MSDEENIEFLWNTLHCLKFSLQVSWPVNLAADLNDDDMLISGRRFIYNLAAHAVKNRL